MDGKNMHIYILLAILLFQTASIYGQDKFIFNPAAPGNEFSTWVDVFASKSEVSVTVTGNIDIPGLVKNSTRNDGFLLTRRLKMIPKETPGASVMQVEYLKTADVPDLLPSGPGTTIFDVGDALKGKTFEIDCVAGTVGIITISDTGAAISTPASNDETTFIRAECGMASRLANRKSLFDGMQVGQTKELSASPASSLFSPEVEQFGIGKWSFKLDKLGTAASGIFAVSGTGDPSSPIAKTFPKFDGTLALENTGRSMELQLKSTSTQSVEKLPDGKSEIVSRSNLTLIYRQKVL
jgi:hypothetical protein